MVGQKKYIVRYVDAFDGGSPTHSMMVRAESYEEAADVFWDAFWDGDADWEIVSIKEMAGEK